MIGRVRGFLSEPSTIDQKFFSDEEIIDYLQMGINELCLETDVNYRIYNFTNTVAGTEFTFPALTGGIEEYLFELKFLLVRDQDWQENIFNDLLRVNPKTNQSSVSAENRAFTCTIYDSTIHLNKTLKVDDEIIIAARWKKADITASGDFPLDVIAEDACVKYATHLGFNKKVKIETANNWFALWNARKEKIEKVFKKNVDQKFPYGLTVQKTGQTLGRGVSNRQVVV